MTSKKCWQDVPERQRTELETHKPERRTQDRQPTNGHVVGAKVPVPHRPGDDHDGSRGGEGVGPQAEKQVVKPVVVVVVGHVEGQVRSEAVWFRV